mgnify:CR=1 FL=1|tara:strand:- start:509 stop:691 length:183 start_codon:yes stop_codon:yes gene_type:complete
MSEFKVVGKEVDEVVTLVVNARTAKDIWNNPSNFGFTKVFSVSFISERVERNQKRELKYT